MIPGAFFVLFGIGAVMATIRYTQERWLVASLYFLLALASAVFAIETLPLAVGH